ncbi:ROK family transcriptional regulator [Microbacterium paludicola]|uniref:ROK family transcriptional regulator n=1 Tax=Microbacterium paludicola TaxID=300019 RepID=A0A4Y9FVW0_9MICO|nr:ROK family transcriptional regulator [Microbacterium paludicola]MBF0815944.1 ROK family transcriptional regulator [Microbacterium paludicola]TFU33415.1 ROK family transcriptional regulator [Microbacterium paludicola]
MVRPIGPSSEHTRSAILDMVRSSGTVSRIELAEMSGLTATSITRIVKSLIEDGLVIETGFGDSTGGKRRSLLELNPKAGFAVGISLDEGRLTYVVVDLGGDVIGRVVTAGIGKASPSAVLERIVEELEELFRELEVPRSQVLGVGVAGAGLDLGAGSRRLSTTADEWDEFAVQEILEARLGLPVVRDNDAACAALGQYWVGRIPATQDFCTLYMSNGFGLGLVSGGRVARGASSNVGEIGHVIIDVDGPACWCGASGCLEMLAAPRAIVRRALGDPELTKELELSGEDAALRRDYDALARAAASGEERSLALVRESARYVAAAVLSTVNVLDLDRLHLSGPGFDDAGPIYAQAISDLVSRHARARAVHGVDVVLSDPGFDAAAVGAAALALQHVLTPHARNPRIAPMRASA